MSAAPSETVSKITSIIEEAGAGVDSYDPTTGMGSPRTDDPPAGVGDRREDGDVSSIDSSNGRKQPDQVPPPDKPQYTEPPEYKAAVEPAMQRLDELDAPSPALQTHMSEVKAIAAQLQQERAQIDALAAKDPGRAAVFMQHHGQRVHRFNAYQQQVIAMAQREHQEAVKGRDARVAAKISEVIPAWRDGAVREQEVGQIKQWMRSQGFSDAEMASVRDPRHVKVLYDAWAASTGVKNPSANRQRQRQKQKSMDATELARRQAKDQRDESPVNIISNLLRNLS